MATVVKEPWVTRWGRPAISTATWTEDAGRDRPVGAPPPPRA